MTAECIPPPPPLQVIWESRGGEEDTAGDSEKKAKKCHGYLKPAMSKDQLSRSEMHQELSVSSDLTVMVTRQKQ